MIIGTKTVGYRLRRGENKAKRRLCEIRGVLDLFEARMSTSRGSGAAGNGGGVQSIPAGSRKMVQSLKEIVNCSDAEIYAVLKDCNMDPNEAVNRLLSQGLSFSI